MTWHLIDHAADPFPGRWIVRGRGYFHIRLGAALWLMTYAR